jgi:hypothetical protein
MCQIKNIFSKMNSFIFSIFVCEMEVLLDLFVMAVDTGDIVAAEAIKTLPLLRNVPFVKRRSEYTHLRHRCRSLRKFVSYRYKQDGSFWVATKPTFNYTKDKNMINHQHDASCTNIALAPRFLLRGFYWTRQLVDVQVTLPGQPPQSYAVWTRTASKPTMVATYYDLAPPHDCGCREHHDMHNDFCESCAPNQHEHISVIHALQQHIHVSFCSVRRLTRCHHVATHVPENIYWPVVDTVTNWDDIADRPNQTIGLNGVPEWPKVLPCIASVTISSTFPYYARVPHVP